MNGAKRPQNDLQLLDFAKSRENRPNTAVTKIKRRDTAFRTRVEPRLSLSNILIVRGESDPTSISIVLKFSNLMSSETMAEAQNGWHEER
jgi:hypothetical protein